MRVLTALLVASCCTGCFGPPSHVQAMDDFVDELEANWDHWHASCKPEAVFAVAYWMLNAAVRDQVAAGAFDHDEAVAAWAIGFGQHYLDAVAAQRARVNASGPWQAAFDWHASGRSWLIEDLLLSMNAHIGHDLVVATHQHDLVERGMEADYFRIDGVFRNETHAIVQRVADLYSPLLRPPVSNNATEAVALQVILEWREAAWEDAVEWHEANETEAAGFQDRLVDDTLRRAAAFQVPKGDTSEERRAYCQAAA